MNEHSYLSKYYSFTNELKDYCWYFRLRRFIGTMNF